VALSAPSWVGVRPLTCVVSQSGEAGGGQGTKLSGCELADLGELRSESAVR